MAEGAEGEEGGRCAACLERKVRTQPHYVPQWGEFLLLVACEAVHNARVQLKTMPALVPRRQGGAGAVCAGGACGEAG